MAVRNDFTAGEVLAAADLNDTFASKVDYALPVNAQTGTTYTFVAADAEKLTTASNGSAVTLTIPPASSVAWPDNTVLRVVNYGAGAVTIDGGSGVTVTNTSSTIAQYGAAVAIRTGSDAWTVVPFGGGDVPSATVSSPAATGQYTDGNGDTWDYFTFTASGTLTVDTAGFADVLLVGGGGGGGDFCGGGGGGGGHLYLTETYLVAGTLTVTVGAGGSGGSVFGNAGQTGNASALDVYATPYGGAGGGGVRDFRPGQNGGSGGGGGGGTSSNGGTPGNGGQAFVSQGNNGGNASSATGQPGGGGGGANAVGGNASTNQAGNGGAGLANGITGSSVTRAGGGGGGSTGGTAGTGGTGGGGAGTTNDSTATSGTANTGGGGGGGGASSTGGNGGNGGSGVVIVRVKV